MGEGGDFALHRAADGGPAMRYFAQWDISLRVEFTGFYPARSIQLGGLAVPWV